MWQGLLWSLYVCWVMRVSYAVTHQPCTCWLQLQYRWEYDGTSAQVYVHVYSSITLLVVHGNDE